MRQSHGPFRWSDAFCRHQFLADYTTNMFGFDFRQGHVYRGELHPGEQQPIVDNRAFEAVQAKLKDRAVTGKVHTARSPSFLSGLSSMIAAT